MCERRRGSRTAFVLALLACVVPAGAATGPARPNIVVGLVDTLRADRLGCYGNEHGLTPTMDRLAARGVLFPNAYAQSSWTKPSVASFFTSRYPHQHGVVRSASVLSPEERTIAEVLHEAGYATGAFVANPFIDRKSGFDQGFDRYEPAFGSPGTRGQSLARGVSLWLATLWARRGPRPPFFLYVHYIEPHIPYAPTAKLESVFGPGHVPDPEAIAQRMTLWRTFAVSAEDLDTMRRIYDAEVAEVDDQISGLVNVLLLYDLPHTIVVLTADHGELIHVPLIVAGPGVAEGARVTGPVSLVDVAPTLLDVVGVPAPDSFRGRSLRESLAPRGVLARTWDVVSRRFADPRIAFSELRLPEARPEPARYRGGSMLRAAVRGGEKAIVPEEGDAEFYDLDDDPHERRPAAQRGGARRALEEAVATLDHGASAPAPTVPLDEPTRARLHALGYAE